MQVGLVQVHTSVDTVARSRCAAESDMLVLCRFIQVWDEGAGRIAYDATTVRTAVEEAMEEALY